MFSLIMTIIGIGYCAVKLTSEKITSKSIDKKIQSNTQTMRDSIKKYGEDRDYIREINSRYYDRDPALFKEAHAVFDSIPALRGIRMNSSYLYNDPRSYNRQTILSIHLAKRGKIDTVVSQGPVFHGITTSKGKQMEFTAEQKKALGRWAQAEIRKFHPECNILWLPGDCMGDLQIDTLAIVTKDKEYL